MPFPMKRLMKLFVVTANRDKFKEISLVLRQFGINSVMRDIELHETGDTLEEISMNKAKEAYRKIKKPLIVDDTGIFFKAYRNFPGIYARRIYLGIGFEGLLKLLKDKSRGAYYKSVVCFYDGKHGKIFSGKLNGTIQKKIYKDKFSREKFPYDRIFVPDGFDKPISLMPLHKKIEFSHRAAAVRKFARWFSQRQKSI
jgi:XTP/dITP diphosphohydrolase